MRTKKFGSVAAVLVAAMLLGGSAGAQTPERTPVSGRSGSRLMQGGYLNLDWAYLLPDRSWSQSRLSKDLYDETATFEARHAASRHAGPDVAFGLRLFGGFAVGVGAARFRTAKTVALSGSVPHPLFYGADRARMVNQPLMGYNRTELGLHGLFSWTIPVTGRVDLALSGGPSWFVVDHDHVVDGAGIMVRETGSQSQYDRVAVGDVRSASERKIVRGANVGVDVTYHLYRSLEPGAVFWTVGVGGFVRWTTGTAEVDQFTEPLDVGGFQTGAGLRFRF